MYLIDMYQFNSHFPNGVVLSLHISLGRTGIFTMLGFPIYERGESESEDRSVMSDSLRPMDCTLHGTLQARVLEWVAFPFSRGSSKPRDQTQVSCIAGRFFTSWATRKPKNTGVGSLSLLQQIFPTQELNQGLLHGRWIFYQLSYEGSPWTWYVSLFRSSFTSFTSICK